MRSSDPRLCTAAMITLFISLNTSQVHAEESDSGNASPVQYKLTLAHYDTQTLHANDANIRISQDNQTIWVAFYHEHPDDFKQLRVGYERTDHLPYTTLVSAIQMAEHGFIGGATQAEIGGPLFGILGFGRTNLKPYDNINFDPNDAITYGVGYKTQDELAVSLYTVRDNRVVDGQKISHLLLKVPMPHEQRLTIDVFNKSGTQDADGLSIRATGAGLGYDWPTYFVKLAYDPKVNFSQERMTRIAFGMRL